MVEISLVKFGAAIAAALMAGGMAGFLFCAILANSKYRDLQGRFDGTDGNGYQPLKCPGEGNPQPPRSR